MQNVFIYIGRTDGKSDYKIEKDVLNTTAKENDISVLLQRQIWKFLNSVALQREKEINYWTEYRIPRGDQIDVFKIMHGYESLAKNMFFTLKTGNKVRGRNWALAKEHFKLDIRKYAFSQRTVGYMRGINYQGNM